MPLIPNSVRDDAITSFRSQVCEQMGFTPFPHQAAWWLASDGLVLGDQLAAPDAPSMAVKLPTREIVRRAVLSRPNGRARVLADLGAFKVGKSKGAAMWATGFAAIPGGRVSLIGLEYDLCAPEFEYLCEALLSDRGMGINAPYRNRPREGHMWIDLPNGCRYEAKSWERKDSLKGKEVDCYIYCEAYMLPGIACFTGVQQNLAARQGYALFPTTPDRPWVKEFHEKGHGDPQWFDWHCTCSIPRSQNPETFDQREMDLNDPTQGGLMTKEQFAIAYLGRLGDFVGRCYNYQRGDPGTVFTPVSHPQLWRDPGGEAVLSNLQIPASWEVLGAADTGTFMSGLLVAFSPEGEAFVVYEQPNYQYVSSELDLDSTSSIPRWADDMRTAMTAFGCHGLWADRNSQYKAELRNNHDISLLPASVNLQTRTEIGREYFQSHKVKLAPWLKILPYEVEAAHWPDEETMAGRFERVKQQDHTLDCLEHLLAKRPIPITYHNYRPATWAEEQGYKTRRTGRNPHLGVQ